MQDSTTKISPLLLDHIYTGDALETLRTLPDGVVNCVVTSPPYYGLRDYGVAGQFGLEQSTREYIGKLVDLFREIRRVLKVNGTAWVNLGDSYNNWGTDSLRRADSSGIGLTTEFAKEYSRKDKRPTDGLNRKSLMMIPARVAIALQDDGWILRSEIVWHKPNPMPESVTDRPTKAHEMIYLLSKSPRYFYDIDAVREPHAPSSLPRALRGVSEGNKWNNGAPGSTAHSISQPRPNTRKEHPEYSGSAGTGFKGHSGVYAEDGSLLINPAGRNSRTVWTIPTAAVKEAHFATYPPELVRRCILAGCPVDGVVLDPFMGSGTTALVARQLNRRYVGIELNPAYVEIAEKRLAMPFQTNMLYYTDDHEAVRND